MRHMSLYIVTLYRAKNHVNLGIELTTFLLRCHICIKEQKIMPGKLKGNILEQHLTLLLIEKIGNKQET